MVKVQFYKYLSDDFEEVITEEGKKISEFFPEIKDWRKHKIFANGKIVDENYIINYADKIFIRSIPYENYDALDWTWTVLTGGIYSFVKSGIDAYEANVAAQKAQKELERLKGITRDETANLPYIKGSSNSIATGKTQPYFIGTALMTPHILNASKSGRASKGYRTISGGLGERQFLNRVYEMGFKKQVLNKIFMGDIQLASFGKNEPFEGIFNFDNKAFSSKDSFIEIRQGNRFETESFNKKIVEQEKSDKLYLKDDENYEDLLYTLEQNSMAADICIMFNGLFHVTENGSRGIRTRHIIPSFSYDYAELAAENREDEATWHDFTFTKGIWHEAVKYIDQTSIYEWTWESPLPTKPSEKSVKKAINEWTLKEGNDIRDDFTYFSYTSKLERTIGKRRIYKITIKIEKEAIIPGYFEDEEETTTFAGNYNKQIRFNAHVDFDWDEVKNLKQPITVRLSTPDEALPAGQDVSDCIVQWIHSYTYDISKSNESDSFIPEKIIEDEALARTVMVGMQIEATKENEELTDSIQIISSGVARVFEKDENDRWHLSEDRRVTSNPAAWWWEVQTSDCHIPSQYDDEEFDIDTFGKWYDFCEKKGFTVDYVITQGKQKDAILEMILNCGRGSTYENIYGKVAVNWDDERENAAGLLNEQNMISFSYNRELSREVIGASATYIDAENNFQQNTITVMYDGRINPETRDADGIIKTVNVDGITTWQNVYRHLLYVMKCDKLRPKKCTASVGQEGIYFVPLTKFLIQHPSLKIGLGNSEIKNLILNEEETQIIGLELYDAVTLDEENIFNVVIQCVNDEYCTPMAREIKGFNGRTKEIEFVEPISTSMYVRPYPGNNLSYGYEIETVTREMLITEVKRTQKGFNLSLVDYDERIFEEVAEFPEYEPILTEPRSGASGIPSTLPAPTIDQVAGIVEEAVKEIDLSLLESPNVYAEIMGCGFSINDEGVTPIAQQIKTVVHVIQENREIEFSFGDFELPEGFSVEIDYKTVIFKVAAGVRITNGILNIPIIYRAILHDDYYADENGIVYCDENGKQYGVQDFEQDYTRYNLGFSYSGVMGGRYWGKINSVENLPENPVIGDYFTWTGEESGEFKPSGCYAWNGSEWKVDSVSSHVGGPLSDVLSVANANLEQNNSTVYQFLDHLTANSVFANLIATNKLLANEAIIESLFANKINIKQGGCIQSDGFEIGNSKGFILNSDGSFILSGGTFTGDINSGPLVLSVNGYSASEINNSVNSITWFNLIKDYPDYSLEIEHIVQGIIDNEPVKSILISFKNAPYDKKLIEYKWSYTGDHTSSESEYIRIPFYNCVKDVTLTYRTEDGSVKSFEGSVGFKYYDIKEGTWIWTKRDAHGNEKYTSFYEAYENFNIINFQINIKKEVGYNLLKLIGLPTKKDILSSTPEGTVYYDEDGRLYIKNN